MKTKVLIIIAVCLVIFGSAVRAQNVIKINILSPIVKTFNIQYERALNANSSVQLGFFYSGFSTGDTKFSGFGITPEYRFYLSESEAPEGVYIAPFLRYQSFTIKDDITVSEADFSAFGGGVILGKQWIFKEKIALDVFIGPTYSSGTVNLKSGSDSFDTGAFDGFGLRTGICFGLKF